MCIAAHAHTFDTSQEENNEMSPHSILMSTIFNDAEISSFGYVFNKLPQASTCP